MSNIFLYAHGGSGNHGCEAIVRSSARILAGRRLTLLSLHPEQDRAYGLDALCDIIAESSESFSKGDLDFWRAYAALKLKHDYIPMDKLRYKAAFSHIHAGDIALSIGGDNYCYVNVQKYVMMHDLLKKRKAKTVLWGCSIEPEIAARPEIAQDLARYDLITAREPITYEALRKINPHTVRVSDPAFLLPTVETELPEGFQIGNTVGVNLSPMAMENEKISGITWTNFTTLIDFILSETDMSVAFIPHVVWPSGDDRIPLRKLYDQYRHTGRVCLVDDLGCEKLKFIISKCRFFVGARTHATIAAYSSCVPTLVLGYSVKSRGIARDLFGTEDGYVVPVQGLKDSQTLKDAFAAIVQNEQTVRDGLQRLMSDYKNKAHVTLDCIAFNAL